MLYNNLDIINKHLTLSTFLDSAHINPEYERGYQEDEILKLKKRWNIKDSSSDEDKGIDYYTQYNASDIFRSRNTMQWKYKL